MSIDLFVGGTLLSQFSKMSVDKSLDNFTGSFRFDVVDSDEYNIERSDAFPIQVGAECKIFVDGELLISGFIDAISGEYSARSHILHVIGRDKTSDLIDSHVGGGLNFSSNITLMQIIQRTIAHLQIFDLTVENQVPDLKPFTREDLDLIAVKPAKTAFDFIEMYARKRHVLLTTDNNGKIIITRNFDKRLNGALINEFSNPLNNVLSARFNYDNSKRFNKYVMRSQKNPVPIIEFVNSVNKDASSGVTAEDMASQDGTAFDDSIRQGRVFEKISESSTTSAQLKDRATWEGNIRRSRALTYMPTVQGFRINDDLWQLNTLVQVTDFFAKINVLMLINRVTFNLDLDKGSTTTLELVDKDSYKLSLQFDKKDKKNKIAPQLIFDPTNPS